MQVMALALKALNKEHEVHWVVVAGCIMTPPPKKKMSMVIIPRTSEYGTFFTKRVFWM